MFKLGKKLISLTVSVAILAVCFIVPMNTSAQTTTTMADKITPLILEYKNLQGGGVKTDKVPDGKGYSSFTTMQDSKQQNVLTADINQTVKFTKSSMQNGAFVVYFGHDKEREVNDTTVSTTAYAYNELMFRMSDGTTTKDLKINGAANATVPIYYISSSDGTVIKTESDGIYAKPAVAADGTYYNEGYYVIPFSSLTSNVLADNTEYSLSLVKAVAWNLKRLGATYQVAATCNFYYDIIGFAANIEDILGTETEGVYQYDAGTTHPVYELGFMTSQTLAAPTLTYADNKIGISGINGKTQLNLYKYGKYYSSVLVEGESYELADLAMGNYDIQALSVDENGSYTAVSAVASKTVFNSAKLKMLRSYDGLLQYSEKTPTHNGVSCVPDGAGVRVTTSNRTYNDFNHFTDVKLELTNELVENGALVFYFKHEATRSVEGVSETAYADVIPNLVMLKEGVSGNQVLSIKASSAARKSAYFISSVDGTVIRNDTYNSSVQLAKKGTEYYNEGYWVVPFSAFNNATGNYDFAANAADGYKLSQIKCTFRNITSLTDANVKAADTVFYFDNFSYVENIEDILGPVVSEANGKSIYTFDNDSTYPVYTLGAVSSNVAELDKENLVIRNKDKLQIVRGELSAEEDWQINVYYENALLYSGSMPAADGALEFNIGNADFARVQIMYGDNISAATTISRAGNLNEDSYIDILDLVGMKKLLANSNTKYNSDINGDGPTDGTDLSMLTKMLLGISIN